MTKSFIRRAHRSIIATLMLVPLLFTFTGCKASNSMINRAFANSTLMYSIKTQLQQQADLIAEMQRMGVIPDVMVNNLNSSLNSIYKAAAALSTDTDTETDVEIGSETNEFIGTVLRSMTMLGDNIPTGPSAATHLGDTETAREFVSVHGSPIDGYSGYNTKIIIENTAYKKLAGYITGRVEPLKPFGEASNSTIKDLVAYVNKLKDIEVYYVDANKVGTTKDLQGFKTAMDGAKADVSKANALVNDYFIATGEKLNFTDGLLSEATAYSAQEIKVEDGGHIAAKYEILLLDRDALLGAFNKTSNSGDMTSGVLIGNKFFITRYPMSVFRGFEQVSTDKTKFLPVFTHPFFLKDGTYADVKGSMFSGDPSAYADTLTAGDKGTAETKCPYVDLYTGAMYYKDAQIGNTHDFMRAGTAELESSIVIRSSKGVYKVADNPNCITTVKQTEVFKPTETLQIGTHVAGLNEPVTLPAKNPTTSSNIMPVVFLMDYLELVYSPNTVGTDAFTAYGRKIRLDEKLILGTDALTANTGTIAYVVGEGATTDAQTGWPARSSSDKTGYNALTMTDFLDIDGVYNADLSAKVKDTAGEANNVSASVHYIPAKTDSFEHPGMVRSGNVAAERSDQLPQIAAGTGVECVMMFGNTSVDNADKDSTPKTPLYGITLYGGIYARGLFSDWINASGNANLIKWAKTVTELGYKNYAISNALLTEKMKGNYAFELNNDKSLALDLNTIIQINKDNTEVRKGGGVMYLRTILLLLGFMLIAYVSVLLAAWALDVNLDLGLNVLEKVSFKHFVAVRSLDEMPAPDPESTTTYLDFRQLIIRCIAFAAVGVIITTVDPVNLIIKVLAALNFLLKVIGQKIFGVNIM